MDVESVESSRIAVGGWVLSRLRWIAVRGLASAVVGVVVLGVGGRLLMLASRLLHPDAVGRVTENGNRIGQFTVDGTIELILFGGLLGGLTAGIVWVFFKEWIPDNPMLVGLGAVAIGGFQLVEADNRDFVILVDPRIDIVLLLGLLFVFGMALHWFDSRLDRRIPSDGGALSKASYALIAAVGVVFLFPVFGTFFSQEFCFCESPPIWTGVFLVGAAATTIIWWVLNLRGATSPPTVIQRLGWLSVTGAVLSGGIHLAAQTIHIL